MASHLERVDGSIDPDDLCGLLERDGAVLVEDALAEARLTALNQELDDLVAATAPGVQHPDHEFFVDFYGTSTIRIDGLPAKSKTFVDVMLSPLITAVADHFLLEHCKDYLLNTGQLIEIGPGETAQKLHRDEDAWIYCPTPKPQLEVEALFALTDFTKDNGATQLVPGSHRWPRERKAEPGEVVQADMKAGSAVFYLGTTLHGGGANVTEREWRRGMFLGFVVGWLRTEENTFLSVPIEHVYGMPLRAQELLGYKSHAGIGVVDVGSPMKLLDAG
jgi:ectoine hydroxylase-related dioxygenase (phytanoyl-CoA dioxygenase family)